MNSSVLGVGGDCHETSIRVCFESTTSAQVASLAVTWVPSATFQPAAELGARLRLRGLVPRVLEVRLKARHLANPLIEKIYDVIKLLSTLI